jgi:DNA-binding transcriptional MerR regulator
MKINIFTFRRGQPRPYDVQDYLNKILTDFGNSGDSIKEIKRLLDNQSAALSLIISKMAEDGKVSAKEIVELGQDYFEDAEFENE